MLLSGFYNLAEQALNCLFGSTTLWLNGSVKLYDPAVDPPHQTLQPCGREAEHFYNPVEKDNKKGAARRQLLRCLVVSDHHTFCTGLKLAVICCHWFSYEYQFPSED